MKLLLNVTRNETRGVVPIASKNIPLPATPEHTYHTVNEIKYKIKNPPPSWSETDIYKLIEI